MLSKSSKNIAEYKQSKNEEKGCTFKPVINKMFIDYYIIPRSERIVLKKKDVTIK